MLYGWLVSQWADTGNLHVSQWADNTGTCNLHAPVAAPVSQGLIITWGINKCTGWLITYPGGSKPRASTKTQRPLDGVEIKPQTTVPISRLDLVARYCCFMRLYRDRQKTYLEVICKEPYLPINVDDMRQQSATCRSVQIKIHTAQTVRILAASAWHYLVFSTVLWRHYFPFAWSYCPSSSCSRGLVRA
jgi:hypothetical protein